MKRECENYMDQYLSLDKGQRLPLELTIHLLCCSECRKEVRALAKAEKIASRTLLIPVPYTDKTLIEIMKKIDISYNPQKNHVHLFQWIILGIILIITFVTVGILTTAGRDNPFQFIFYLFFAISISAYCMLFVGTNLDFFVKKINSKKLNC